MQKSKLIELEHNIKYCKIFYKNCIDAQKGYYNEIRGFLEEFKKSIEELTEKEVLFINKNLFDDDLKFYNIQKEQKEFLLPIIYTYDNHLQNENLVCLSKYGEDQQYDLIDANGQILFSGARDISSFDNNIIFIQDHDLSQKLYHYMASSSKLVLITELEKNKIYGEFKFSENRLFVEKGYYNEKLEPASPFCFDNGKEFSEGLAAVVLNGKWGYINSKGEIAIDFQFGYASSFKKGQAEVLILNSNYKNAKGVWIEKECKESELMCSNFINKKFTPLAILRKKYLSTSEFKEQYHDFRLETHKENALSNYGTYATINTNGQIINQEAFNHTTESNTTESNTTESNTTESNTTESNTTESNTTESNTTENHDVNYWLKKITLNGDNVTFIPDELYCNKQFIKQAIQLNPESFYYLSQFYSDDDEVGSFAFKTDPKSSYSYLSERLKASYKNQFEMHQSDEIDFDNMNSPLSQQEGDPDLPF